MDPDVNPEHWLVLHLLKKKSHSTQEDQLRTDTITGKIKALIQPVSTLATNITIFYKVGT